MKSLRRELWEDIPDRVHADLLNQIDGEEVWQPLYGQLWFAVQDQTWFQVCTQIQTEIQIKLTA